MARPYVNWAKLTVTPKMTGTYQPFKQTTSDRYSLGKEPKAPSNARLRIVKVMVPGAPGSDPAEVQKAVSGAVLIRLNPTCSDKTPIDHKIFHCH